MSITRRGSDPIPWGSARTGERAVMFAGGSLGVFWRFPGGSPGVGSDRQWIASWFARGSIAGDPNLDHRRSIIFVIDLWIVWHVYDEARAMWRLK